MKLYTLMENTTCRPDFDAEHGLSLYIETDRHRLLFDIGQSGTFADNAEKLGVDLAAVDCAVLSHGHYDHGGGLKRFLEINDHAPVYLNRNAFGEYYHGPDRYIGLDPQLKKSGRLILTPDKFEIDDELSLCTCNEKTRPYPTDSAGLEEKTGDGFIPDIFLHEQYLTIRDGDRRIVLSGCSHKGILNIVEWLQPDVLIGGFHFKDKELSSGRNADLDLAAQILGGYPNEYYTCHCTGLPQYDYLKLIMGGKLHYLSAGQTIEI